MPYLMPPEATREKRKNFFGGSSIWLWLDYYFSWTVRPIKVKMSPVRSDRLFPHKYLFCWRNITLLISGVFIGSHLSTHFWAISHKLRNVQFDHRKKSFKIQQSFSPPWTPVFFISLQFTIINCDFFVVHPLQSPTLTENRNVVQSQSPSSTAADAEIAI